MYAFVDMRVCAYTCLYFVLDDTMAHAALKQEIRTLAGDLRRIEVDVRKCVCLHMSLCMHICVRCV